MPSFIKLVSGRMPAASGAAQARCLWIEPSETSACLHYSSIRQEDAAPGPATPPRQGAD